MPRLLYDYCRQGEHRPIRVGSGLLIPTDRQTQDYLLCQHCEDVLNCGGEGWLADKLATWERQFPFYDLLSTMRPVFEEDGMLVYMAAKNPTIESKKIIHFALGIFWKASVHSWTAKSSDPRIDLGAYSEKLRKWLRSETDLPDDLHLVVVVERPARAQITITDPYEAVPQGGHTYFFHVPGIQFMMEFGNTAHDAIASVAITSRGNPINVSEALTDDFERLMVGAVREARKTAAYLKAKAKIDAERRGKQ